MTSTVCQINDPTQDSESSASDPRKQMTVYDSRQHQSGLRVVVAL